MKLKHNFLIVSVFLALLFTPFSWASENAKGEANRGSEHVQLEAQKGNNAQVSAQIQKAQEGKKQISIDLKGLKPNSLYTVWLVNEKPKMEMAGLGSGDYSFRTDEEGNAIYTANVSEQELAKWKLLEIAYHPDNDPKNMKNMQIAAKGKINAGQKAAE